MHNCEESWRREMLGSSVDGIEAALRSYQSDKRPQSSTGRSQFVDIFEQYQTACQIRPKQHQRHLRRRGFEVLPVKMHMKIHSGFCTESVRTQYDRKRIQIGGISMVSTKTQF